jgi:hypothetical protein
MLFVIKRTGSCSIVVCRYSCFESSAHASLTCHHLVLDSKIVYGDIRRIVEHKSALNTYNPTIFGRARQSHGSRFVRRNSPARLPSPLRLPPLPVYEATQPLPDLPPLPPLPPLPLPFPADTANFDDYWNTNEADWYDYSFDIINPEENEIDLEEDDAASDAALEQEIHYELEAQEAVPNAIAEIEQELAPPYANTDSLALIKTAEQLEIYYEREKVQELTAAAMNVKGSFTATQKKNILRRLHHISQLPPRPTTEQQRQRFEDIQRYMASGLCEIAARNGKNFRGLM